MPKEFKFPDIGEGITEGEIVRWYIKEGDKVEEHQVVGEIETDKAVAEIPSPYAGIVLKINFKEGDTVKVGQTLFIIGEEGEKITQEAKVPVMRPAGAVGYLEEAPEEEEIEPKPVIPVKAVKEEILATPAVRKLAKDLGVDLTKVVGTGPEGRITEGDVRKASEARVPAIRVARKYDIWGYVDRIPLKGIRKAIARHMIESVKHIPHVTTMDEAEVTELVKVREREKLKAQEQGIKLTYLPFIMKACIAALKEFPLLNASLDEENEEIIIKKYYNIGFAVDIDGEGLVVPVIKYADKKSILDIAKELQELSDKARARKLDLQDMRGSSFSITNYGSFGGIFATPIINYPDCAVLGVGRIYEKPVVIEGKIEIGKVLPLSLTFDHRIADGAYATRFLNSVILNLKAPEKLME
ncbi:MAG: dihydrolipoamide acetyltransferase family protein [Candidatus Aenigmatarchaeota archaeon]